MLLQDLNPNLPRISCIGKARHQTVAGRRSFRLLLARVLRLSSFELFVLSFSAPGIKPAAKRFKQLEGTIETTIVKKFTVGGVS